MELLILGLAFIILGSPWILTLLNIINLFKIKTKKDDTL